MMMWSVAALALLLLLSPLYVSLCAGLAATGKRGALRLRATQLGSAELERIRATLPTNRDWAIPELPAGRGSLRLRATPAPRLRELALIITWAEGHRTARAEWSTLVPASPRREP
jgi:hypothetical protein